MSTATEISSIYEACSDQSCPLPQAAAGLSGLHLREKEGNVSTGSFASVLLWSSGVLRKFYLYRHRHVASASGFDLRLQQEWRATQRGVYAFRTVTVALPLQFMTAKFEFERASDIPQNFLHTCTNASHDGACPRCRSLLRLSCQVQRTISVHASDGPSTGMWRSRIGAARLA